MQEGGNVADDCLDIFPSDNLSNGNETAHFFSCGYGTSVVAHTEVLKELHPSHVGCVRTLILDPDPVTVAPAPGTQCGDHDKGHRLDMQPAWVKFQ